MSRYRKVDPRIWNDAKFRDLDDKGRLAFFFLLTHPHMTAIGAMRASVPGLAAEIGWSLEAFREAFDDLLSKAMVQHDQKASLVWLPNFLKYNPPESPNVVKAWSGAVDLLPECDLLSRVIASSVAFAKAMSKGFREALPEAFAKAMPIQEQEQEQEQEEEISPDGDSSAERGSAGPMDGHVATEPQSGTHCPHQEIIALYHELLPTCPRVAVWSETRKRYLQSRWREDKSRQSLGWWSEFFLRVARSEFLTGRSQPQQNRPPFVADLEWLVKPSNFVKVLEGKYDTKAATVTPIRSENGPLAPMWDGGRRR